MSRKTLLITLSSIVAVAGIAAGVFFLNPNLFNTPTPTPTQTVVEDYSMETPNLPEGYGLTTIGFSKNYAVAVGLNNTDYTYKVFTYKKDQNWVARETPSLTNVMNIVFLNNTFILTAMDDANSTVFYTSKDGNSWELLTTPDNLQVQDVTFDNNTITITVQLDPMETFPTAKYSLSNDNTWKKL